MLLIFGWFIFAVLIAILADKWGRSGAGWFLLSLIISPLICGLILLVLGKNDAGLLNDAIQYGDKQKCPYCAELIQKEAILCRFCGKDLNHHAKRANENARTEALAVHLSAAGRAAANQSAGRSQD